SLEHLCCSEVSISPLFRWPNSVCHFNLTTKAGRVECQLILSKHLKGLTLGKDSVTVTLQNDTEITIPTNPLPLNDGSPIFEIAEKNLLNIDTFQL
ncbi:hypothetical protein P4I26_11025, partial [Escherichia coli]